MRNVFDDAPQRGVADGTELHIWLGSGDVVESRRPGSGKRYGGAAGESRTWAVAGPIRKAPVQNVATASPSTTATQGAI